MRSTTPGRVRGCGPSVAGDRVVGFVMISDGIPAERLAADDDLLGPYFLWRLLIDQHEQRKGYGTATLDAVVAYSRRPPRRGRAVDDARGQGPGSPQPFYERYGFVATGEFKSGTKRSSASICASPSR